MRKKIKEPVIFSSEEIGELLNKLSKHSETKNTIISLYLPNLLDNEFHKSWESLFSIEQRDLKISELEKNEKEKISLLLNELDDYFKQSKEVGYFHTLIIFKSPDFFYLVDPPVILEKLVVISPFPFIQPLKNLQKEKGKILVVAVDREKSVFFIIENDGFKKEIGQIKDIVPQKIKGGSESWKGLKEKNILRHIDWHLNEHLKRSESKLISILKKEKFNKIYLGGHEEIVSKFKKNYLKIF